MPLAQSFVRSALKFAPWELAHTASYRIAASEAVMAWQLGVVVLSLLMTSFYVVSLLLGAQRTPYDRAAGSRVQLYNVSHFDERSFI